MGRLIIDCLLLTLSFGLIWLIIAAIDAPMNDEHQYDERD